MHLLRIEIRRPVTTAAPNAPVIWMILWLRDPRLDQDCPGFGSVFEGAAPRSLIQYRPSGRCTAPAALDRGSTIVRDRGLLQLHRLFARERPRRIAQQSNWAPRMRSPRESTRKSDRSMPAATAIIQPITQSNDLPEPRWNRGRTLHMNSGGTFGFESCSGQVATVMSSEAKTAMIAVEYANARTECKVASFRIPRRVSWTSADEKVVESWTER